MAAQYDIPRVPFGHERGRRRVARGIGDFGGVRLIDETSGVLKRLHGGWPFRALSESGGLGLALAAVRDLREHRGLASAAEVEAFETDVLAGLVLARASAGLADSTIRGEVGQLEQIRDWFGRPLWEMQQTDADVYFGQVLRGTLSGTRLARAQALTTYFAFVELRYKVELHAMTGRVVQCPIDEMNRPRGRKYAKLRIPPSEAQIATLFTGWSGELATCRKFAPAAATTPRRG
jgi:hypothetical protein